MERIWLKSYPPGVPADIDPSVYTSLTQLLEQSFRAYAARNAFVCMGKAITYGELDRLSRGLAAYLQAKGLPRGARIALMMPNVLQYPVAIAAVLRAGYVVVNVNPLYKPRELEHQLRVSGAQAIVILENFATTLQSVVKNTSVKHIVVASIGGPDGREGRTRQFRCPSREEDGAGMLAAGCGQVQRCSCPRPSKQNPMTSRSFNTRAARPALRRVRRCCIETSSRTCCSPSAGSSAAVAGAERRGEPVDLAASCAARRKRPFLRVGRHLRVADRASCAWSARAPHSASVVASNAVALSYRDMFIARPFTPASCGTRSRSGSNC